MPTASSSEQTTQSGRQSNSRLSNTCHKIREAVKNNWALMAISVILILIIWTPYFATGHEWKSPDIHWLPLSAMTTIIYITILAFWKKWWLLKNIPLFNSFIFGTAIIGGTIAFLLPLGIANNFTKDGEGTALRQMLIYTTGGLLGVITLSETRRKNDEEIKKNKQDKQKNKKDHIRQVHAERRDRYTKAIEQLADEKAAIRLGGIYTLVGLVDEWLTDKSIKYESDRRKEGQVIINNLCSYIRSPFLTAERIEVFEVHQRLKAVEKLEAALSPYKVPPQHKAINKRYQQFIDTNIHKEPEDIATEYAKLYEEQDIRRAIFTMMSSRVNRFDKKQGKSIPGLWSGFDFNFRNAKIFYPLNDINIESPDFNGAIFIIDANFQGSYFSGKASLIGATFRAKPKFSRAIFNSELDKENSEIVGAPERFEEKIITSSTFYKTIFEQEASFTDSMFLQCPVFMNTKFTKGADFTDSLFNFNTAKNLRLHSLDMSAGQTSMQSDSPEDFILPRGARLFDPGSWDEDQQKYTRFSERAKRIEESDNQGETPSE